MINIVKKIFKLKHVISLGRAGLIYFDGKNRFFIDSENLLGEKHDVAVYYKDIRPIESKIILSEDDKKHLAEVVSELLRKDGIKAMLF